MACSLPVITTDVGGTGEIVNDESKCGIRIQFGDIDGMANAMGLLFENSLLREEYGRNGLETVMKEFSVSAMIEKPGRFTGSAYNPPPC